MMTKPTSRLWSKKKKNAILSPSDVAYRTSISQHDHDTWKALTEANIKWKKADVRILTSNNHTINNNNHKDIMVLITTIKILEHSKWMFLWIKDLEDKTILSLCVVITMLQNSQNKETKWKELYNCNCYHALLKNICQEPKKIHISL